MNLYLISQDVIRGYDYYDSAVVAAPNEEIAKRIYPDDGEVIEDFKKLHSIERYWCDDIEDVKCKLIGKAKNGTKQGLILSSFNAG